MRKIFYIVSGIAVVYLLQAAVFLQPEALPAWKKQAYQKIIADSATVKNEELPLKESVFDHDLKFLEPSDIKERAIDNFIIVLGSMPLDESTPTLDMTYRILKGVELLKADPKSVMVVTGGKTAGRISEAEMMGVIAWSRGVDPGRILLEGNSRTTRENAQFTAELLKGFSIHRSYLVSKNEHLEWATPYFREYPIFENIGPVDSGVTFDQIISNMEDYLKTHENETVRQRLEDVKRKHKGVD